MKSYAAKLLICLTLAGIVAVSACASCPAQGKTDGLMSEVVVNAKTPQPMLDEVVATAEVPDHLRGIMSEVVVEARGPEMLLDEVVAAAEAPEHLRGIMPEVEAIAEVPDHLRGIMIWSATTASLRNVADIALQIRLRDFSTTLEMTN